MKNLLGESEIEAVLQRLDRLTQEEGWMIVAQTLEVVHKLMNNVKVVMNGMLPWPVTDAQLKCYCLVTDGKASANGIWNALGMLFQFCIA